MTLEIARTKSVHAKKKKSDDSKYYASIVEKYHHLHADVSNVRHVKNASFTINMTIRLLHTQPLTLSISQISHFPYFEAHARNGFI